MPSQVLTRKYFPTILILRMRCKPLSPEPVCERQGLYLKMRCGAFWK